MRRNQFNIYPSTPITIISYFCINISPLKKVSQSIKFKFLTNDIKKLTLLKKNIRVLLTFLTYQIEPEILIYDSLI